MKRAHQPGQIITPRNPLAGRSPLPWARDITRAIQQLRDRKVYYSPGITGGGRKEKPHPWKATASDEKIIISPGWIMVPIAKGAGVEDPAPIVYAPVKYAGGEIELTEPGWIYARANRDAGANLLSHIDITGMDDPLGLFSRLVASIDVVFSTAAPGAFAPAGNDTYYPVAQVEFLDGVASVKEQILDHNVTQNLTFFGLV